MGTGCMDCQCEWDLTSMPEALGLIPCMGERKCGQQQSGVCDLGYQMEVIETLLLLTGRPERWDITNPSTAAAWAALRQVTALKSPPPPQHPTETKWQSHKELHSKASW